MTRVLAIGRAVRVSALRRDAPSGWLDEPDGRGEEICPGFSVTSAPRRNPEANVSEVVVEVMAPDDGE